MFKRKVDVEGREMEMVLRLGEKEKCDTLFSLTLRDVDVLYHHQMKRDYKDPSLLSSVDILKMIAQHFFPPTGSAPEYGSRFRFVPAMRSPIYGYFSRTGTNEYNGKKKKRKVSSEREQLDLELSFSSSSPFMEYQIICTVKLIVIRRLEIGTIPNEVLIEIFRFLPPLELLNIIKYVNKRFSQLIESEYLFKIHYYPSFVDTSGLPEIPNDSKDTSFREYVIKEYKNRLCFQIANPTSQKIEGVGKTLQRKDKSKKSTEGFNYLYSGIQWFGTSQHVSVTENCEWKIRVKIDRTNEDTAGFYDQQTLDVVLFKESTNPYEYRKTRNTYYNQGFPNIFSVDAVRFSSSSHQNESGGGGGSSYHCEETLGKKYEFTVVVTVKDFDIRFRCDDLYENPKRFQYSYRIKSENESSEDQSAESFMFWMDQVDASSKFMLVLSNWESSIAEVELLSFKRLGKAQKKEKRKR